MISRPMRRRQGNRTKRRGAELDQIFLGGQGEIRPEVSSPGGQRAHVRRRVGMMVGKDLEAEDVLA